MVFGCIPSVCPPQANLEKTIWFRKGRSKFAEEHRRGGYVFVTRMFCDLWRAELNYLHAWSWKGIKTQNRFDFIKKRWYCYFCRSLPEDIHSSSMWGEDSEDIIYYILYIIYYILYIIYYVLYIHSCSMWEGGFRRAEPGALSLVEHNAFKGLGGRWEIEDKDEDEEKILKMRMRNWG